MAGNNRKNGNNMREIFKTLSCVTQFGISMIVPIAMCFFGGLWLDKVLGTSFIAIMLFFVGAIAGARNVYVLAKKFFGES